MSDHFEGKLDITMVKAHCVVITAQVDMNFIVICDGVPSKKMNLMMMMMMMNESKILDLGGGWCRSLTLFWRSLSGHIIFCIVFQM